MWYTEIMTGPQILDLEMDPTRNDAGAESVREYFKILLTTLFEEGEGFSGKRPFGNSGWEYELYEPIIKGGALEGKFDSDGCVEEVDDAAAYALIYKAIDAL